LPEMFCYNSSIVIIARAWGAMVKHRKSAKPEESVLRDAKEVTAVEQYWHAAERPKSRKPPKNYKYIDELAHLQFELIKLQEWVRLQGLKVAVIFEGRDAAGQRGGH
jgi:polyphosphate kinase 2 (PPK2 family)